MNLLAVKAIAVVGLLLAVFATGYRQGAVGVRAEWAKETTEREQAENTALLTRVKNNERIAEQQEIDRQKLTKGHADEIAKIHAAYAADRRLRIDANVCRGSTQGTEAKSSGGSDAAVAGTLALPDQVERDLRALMLEADTIVASCRVAQKFIETNGMAP